MTNLFTEIPEREPAEIVAGDLLQWKRPDLATDYAPGTYQLLYKARLEGAGSTVITISTTAADFAVSVASATTAAYTAGRYRWSAYIVRVSDSERVEVDSGSWVVEANKTTATTDPRSHARKVLDLIKSLLEGRAAADVASYSIAGRSLTKMSIQELLQWKAVYERDVKAEEAAEAIANGMGTGRRVLVRFTGN